MRILGSLATELSPPPDATSRGRPWEGVVVNLHNWLDGGQVTSPVLDHDVIAMRVSGTVRLTQTRAGETHTATVTPGNMTIHPREIESSWNWDKPGAIGLLRIPPRLLTEAAEATTLAPPPRTTLANCFGGRDAFVQRIMVQLLEELRSPVHPAQEYISQALSVALATHLVYRFNAAAVRADKQPGGLSPRALERVQEYVNAHLGERIDLQTLAALANVSKFHFARMFKERVGISPMVYLERMRMRRAQELLRLGTMPLSRIALAVGYEDQSYFTRRFKLFHGITPARYALDAGVRPFPEFPD